MVAERFYEFTTILGDRYGSISVDPEGLQIRSRDALDGHMPVVEAERLAQAILDRYADSSGKSAFRPPRENVLRLMYVTTTVVWEAHVPFDYPLPAVGEEIEIGEERYRVSSRVWSLSGKGDVGVGLAIHVRDVGRPERELG